MDIYLYNTINHLHYLIDNQLTLNNETLKKYVNLLKDHKYSNNSLYKELIDNISNKNTIQLVNQVIPELVKEFTICDTGIISYLLNY